MIVVDKNIQFAANALAQFDSVTEVDALSITNKLLVDHSATALFVRSPTRVNSRLLENTSVQFVASATAGIDHVDMDYLLSRNIPFSYAPGSNANAVAEFVIASILNHVSNPQSITVGVVGFGNIGRCVAHYAHLLGATVLVNDPPLSESRYHFPSYTIPCSLSELMSASDVVTIHVPYTTDDPHPTHNLISQELIWHLRPQATLINTSRGGVTDEDTLVQRHVMQRINLVLDVYQNEPNLNPNTVQCVHMCTPHVAGYTLDAKLNGTLSVVEAYCLLRGLPTPPMPTAHHSAPNTHHGAPNSEQERIWEGPLHFSDPNALRDLLLARRPLVADAAHFRKAWLDNPTVEQFQTSRNEYPLRNETLSITDW